MAEPYAVPDFGKTLRDTLIVAGQERLQEELKSQAWYQRYSNTAATVVSGISAFIVWAAGNQVGLPNWVQMVLGGVIVIAQILGVKATKNGLTDSVVTKVTDPAVMDSIAAEAEKFITSQLEAAYRAIPQLHEDISVGEHRALEHS